MRPDELRRLIEADIAAGETCAVITTNDDCNDSP
jgi:hypothetical protein